MVDGSTALRAFLINLDRWVSEGIEPPASAFPRLADGTAITREAALEQFSAFPGMALLDPAQLPRLTRVDLGPDAERRTPASSRRSTPMATRWLKCACRTFGCRGDPYGLDAASSRDRRRGPVPGHDGHQPAFAPAPAERQASGDPRVSIAERYRDRDDYVSKARAAAEALAAAGHIVAEDVDLAVELATKRYDVLARAPVSVG